jgi:uncharacterized repeat protein (TIGR03847 family)
MSELTPEIFTADYIGTPGERSFYVQARDSSATHSYEIEKEQIRALAEKLREVLVLVDQEDTVLATEPARDPALELEQPIEPDYQIGTIGLAYDESSDIIVVILQPADAEEPEEAIIESDVGDRVLLRRDQVRAFILHAASILSEGRPTCQLCGLPIDPEGHRCPASNGQRIPPGG